MKRKSPVVCALVPAYNAGRHLRAAVESLLQQTRPLNLIVVIDDGSTDGSIEGISDLLVHSNLIISPNPRNLGRAESMNRRFQEIEADYFVLLDADDIALPERVERQVAFMDANPELGCSSSFIRYISETGKPVGTGQLDLLSKDRFQEYLTGKEPFGLFCPAVIIREAVVKNPELRFRGEFWPADDLDLWNRIAEAGWGVLAQPEILVEYRVHSGSVVTGSYIRTRLQFEWLRECLRARRRGAPEPSRDEFLAAWESAPWLQRINRARKNHAKACYRSAGFAFAEQKWITATILMFQALTLQPSHVSHRFFQQYFSKNGR